MMMTILLWRKMNARFHKGLGWDINIKSLRGDDLAV